MIAEREKYRAQARQRKLLLDADSDVDSDADSDKKGIPISALSENYLPNDVVLAQALNTNGKKLSRKERIKLNKFKKR